MDTNKAASRSSGSPLDAIEPALTHTKRMLFEPFDLKKWFVLGFIIFLARLYTSSGWHGPSGGDGTPGSSCWTPGGGPSPQAREAAQWILDHGPLILLAAAGLFLLINVIGAAIQYLHARGHFMFIECVAENKALVGETWRNAGRPAWTYFLFRLALFCILLWAAVLLIALPSWGLIRSVADGRFSFPGSLAAFLPGLLIYIPLLLLAWLAAVLVRDFVTPVMFLRRIDFLPAMERTVGLWRKRVGDLFLYVVLRFLMSICLEAVGVAVACLTCCIGLLPVVYQTITAPIHVFIRSWTLAILEGFGPEYASISRHGDETTGHP